MKKHFFSGVILGGAATALSIFLFSPVNGVQYANEIENELELKKLEDEEQNDKKDKE